MIDYEYLIFSSILLEEDVHEPSVNGRFFHLQAIVLHHERKRYVRLFCVSLYPLITHDDTGSFINTPRQSLG